jgi:autotransporter-associated beta strand protein
VGGISDITGAGSISNGCATASNSILTINSSVDSSYNGALQDGSATCTLGLTKTGAGTLTLVGTWGGGWQNISYTGPTTISGGKLVIQDGVNAFASTITNNAALEIRSSNVQFGFSKPIGGTGSVAFKSTYSAGYIALGNTVSNTYTGGTTVQGGGLVLQASGGAIAIPGDMTISDSGDGTDTYVVHYAANQIASTGVVSFNPTASGKAGYYLYGNAQTLAGISDSTNYGKVANGSSTPCTLTISNSNCTYNGILTDGGTASLALVKTGLGTMTLGGTGVIDLTGGITVNGGNLYLAKTSGVAVPGALNMSAPSGNTWVYVNGNNQFGANATLNFQGGYYPYFVMQGYNVSVAGISDSNGTGVIENTEYGTASLATLTINNSTACSYNGYIRDTYAGSGQLAMIKNGTGTLTLSGDVANNFTGGLTINAGTVDFENTENDVAHPYTVNAGGHLVLNGVQLAAAASAMSLIAESATDDYANAVPDTNNGTMSIVGSTYFNARNLVGTGTLMVKDDAVVYAHSLVQDTLVIGGTSSYSPAVAVPEPGTMMLLAFAILALAGVGIRKMNRG